MNRLTIRNSDGSVSQPLLHTGYWEEVLNRLAYYEDADERRCLMILPCKPGDTIYRIGDPIKKLYEWEIAYVEIYPDEIVFVDDSDNMFCVEDIGNCVFLTRKEAEAALREQEETK